MSSISLLKFSLFLLTFAMTVKLCKAIVISSMKAELVGIELRMEESLTAHLTLFSSKPGYMSLYFRYAELALGSLQQRSG